MFTLDSIHIEYIKPCLRGRLRLKHKWPDYGPITARGFDIQCLSLLIFDLESVALHLRRQGWLVLLEKLSWDVYDG